MRIETCATLVKIFPFLQIHFGGRIYDGEEFVAAQRPRYGFVPGARQTPDPAIAGRMIDYWMAIRDASFPPP